MTQQSPDDRVARFDALPSIRDLNAFVAEQVAAESLSQDRRNAASYFRRALIDGPVRTSSGDWETAAEFCVRVLAAADRVVEPVSAAQQGNMDALGWTLGQYGATA